MLSGARRTSFIVGGAAVAFLLVLWYLNLRGTHRKDFPFLWGSLFVNGLLLIVAGAIIALVVVVAARGAQKSQLLAALVIGLPGLGLAFADYGLSELELDIIPGRFVQDSGHQIGMIALGIAAGLVLFALVPSLGDATADEATPADDATMAKAETQTADAD